MKQTYNKNNNRMIIAAESRLSKKRKGMVFNALTKQFDLKTELGAENPRTGQIWCEDIVDYVEDDFGRKEKVYGKWIDKDLIKVI